MGGEGNRAPLSLHAPVTATLWGQGSACATGTSSNWDGTGEASGSCCPQRGAPVVGTALTSLALSPCQTSHSRSSLCLLPLLQMAGALSPCPSFVTPPALSLHLLGALESPLCQGGGRGKGFPPHLPPLLSGGRVRRDVRCPTATYIQREREEDHDPFTRETALGLTPSSHLRPAPSS